MNTLRMLLFIMLAGLLTIALSARAASGVLSVFGRTGAVRALVGDYDTSLVPENGNLYFSMDRSRTSISVQAPLVYDSIAGVISCPTCNSSSGSAGTAIQNTSGSALGTFTALRLQNGSGTTWTLTDLGSGIGGLAPNVDTTSFLTLTGTQTATNKIVMFQAMAVASLGSASTSGAGTAKYCTDCTTADTCTGSGSGHLAVSNGTTWTCQ